MSDRESDVYADMVKQMIDEAESVEEAIGLAIGGGSACWSNLSGAGTFDSDRANVICDALLNRVRDYVRGGGM